MPTHQDLAPAAFFSHEPGPAPELFDPEAPVWAALARLKDFFADQIWPDWPEEWGRNPGPLPQTLVLYQPGTTPEPAAADDESPVFAASLGPADLPGPPSHEPPLIIPGDQCTISYDGVAKGGLQVIHQGEILAGASVLMAGTVLLGRRFRLGRGVLVESGAFLKEPLIVGDHSEIRQGAYLRGHCLIGRRCVVGHVTEVKHAIFCDDAKAGHFAYLGDTILGPRVNLGAGTKMANLRFTGGNVQVRHAGRRIDSGLKKFGAILGADCQTGCNAVTNPGTLLGSGSLILPNTTAPSGYHPPKSIIKS